MRQPWVLPAAVALTLLAGFTAGIVYRDQDVYFARHSPESNVTITPATPPTGQPKQPESKPEPAPASISRSSRGSLSQQSSEVHRAAGKALEMMRRENVPPQVQQWVNHFVNRGLVEVPTLTDEEMKLARSLLGRNEIIEWLGAGTPYLLEKAGYEIPADGPVIETRPPKTK